MAWREVPENVATLQNRDMTSLNILLVSLKEFLTNVGANMTKIDYYFATISPYTYLAGTRLEEVAAKHGAEINYIPVDLPKLFSATGGQLPKDRHISRQEYRLIEMRRWADKLGYDMNVKPAFFPTNMAPSSYALIAAAKAGGGDLGALVHAFTKAVWAEEKNIAEEDVIRDCLTAAGFDAELATSGQWEAAEEYANNTDRAAQAGVFGAPFYVVNGERFWGQDRIEDVDAFLAAL